MHVKRKFCAFYGVKQTNWIIVCETFFEIRFLKKILQNRAFQKYFFLQNHASQKKYFFKIWRDVKFLIQNLTQCNNFFSEIWFLSCFLGSDWMMISSVNVNTKFFERGESKDNASYS